MSEYFVLSFPPMCADNIANTGPQFETAEYAGAPETQRCQACNQPLASGYYRANGNPVCSSCADKLRSQMAEGGNAPFVRALMFGIGAAILGLVIYAAFGIMTGWVIGYLSLAVGYMIGKAMIKGSNGVGGRRYQIAAVLLTYAAVSMAAVPIGIAQYSKQKQAVRTEQPQSGQSGQQQLSSTTRPDRTEPDVAVALARLAFLGLASPFLELADPLQGLIGLVILFVGMQIAWKTTAGTAGVQVTGPF